MSTPTPRPLVGSAQAAATLGISRATFNRWVALGRITPTVNMTGVSGARLYDPHLIDAYATLMRKRGAA